MGADTARPRLDPHTGNQAHLPSDRSLFVVLLQRCMKCARPDQSGQSTQRMTTPPVLTLEQGNILRIAASYKGGQH